VNHTLFPKDYHLPDCASRVNQVRKGHRVEKWRPTFGYEMVVNRITQHERPQSATRHQQTTAAI